MKRVFGILGLMVACFLLAGPQTARAQDAAARAQVSAATANAITSLRNEIMNVRIQPTLTVGQFLEQTEARKELDQALQRCQQIGGPRWIDDQTVQVKLEISGIRVATALVGIAASHPTLSPINAGELDQRLSAMKQRTFMGTGTSISTQRIEGIRPVGVSDAWASVSDDVRVRTLTAARADAAQQIMGSIRPIELTPGRTVADVLATPAASQRMNDWLNSRPVTRLRYTEDLEVEVGISAPPGQVLDEVLNAGQTAADVQLRGDEQQVDRLRQEFGQRIAESTGRAKVGQAPPPVEQPARAIITLPAQPPQWVWQSLDVEAVAERADSPLRTKSAAEAKAVELLRAKIGALKMDQTTILDDMARVDPALADAINRTLLRARVYKVEYRADGSVMVRMTLDPRDLWQELTRAAE